MCSAQTQAQVPHEVTCSCSGTPKNDACLKGLGHFCPQIQAETHLAKGSSWIGTRQGHSSWTGSVDPSPSIGTPPHPPCHPSWQRLNNRGAKSRPRARGALISPVLISPGVGAGCLRIWGELEPHKARTLPCHPHPKEVMSQCCKGGRIPQLSTAASPVLPMLAGTGILYLAREMDVPGMNPKWKRPKIKTTPLNSPPSVNFWLSAADKNKLNLSSKNPQK